MKKLLLMSAATLVFASATYAQTDVAYAKNKVQSINKEEASVRKEKREAKKELRELKGKEVSEMAKAQFEKDFNGITDVSWERIKNYDEASFIKDGQVTSAFYDDNGELVGTTVEKDFTDLPAAAQDVINNKYHDYTVTDVLFFDDNELNETDMDLYNQQFEDKDSYLVELKKDNKKIVVQVSMEGDVSYFTRLS